MKYKQLLRLMRPKHYLKNILIFLPLLFSGAVFESDSLSRSIIAFIAFSLMASAIYIFNDLMDKDLDKLHPTKKLRPLASGAVGVRTAVSLLSSLVIASFAIQWFALESLSGTGLLGFYLLINVLYSLGLKDIPIADVAILSLGFVIRVFYGGDAIDVEISKWLYLAILAFSFYLSLGKRRNEIQKVGSKTRKVNRFYSKEFLDKNMYVCLGLTIMYYSLWAIDPTQKYPLMFLTVPLVIIIVMTYSLSVESSQSDGDPVSIVLSSRPLLSLMMLYGVLMIVLVYLTELP